MPGSTPLPSTRLQYFGAGLPAFAAVPIWIAPVSVCGSERSPTEMTNLPTPTADASAEPEASATCDGRPQLVTGANPQLTVSILQNSPALISAASACLLRYNRRQSGALPTP